MTRTKQLKSHLFNKFSPEFQTKVLSILKVKDNSALLILSLGFIGSAALHAAVMLFPMPTLWQQASPESEDTIEVIVEVPELEKTVVAEKPEPAPDIPTEPEVIPQDIPVEVAPPIIALAPELAQNNIGRDAPASDSIEPMTSTSNDITIPTNVVGKIIKENAKGWGFGLHKGPTGFMRDGDPKGDPKGVIDGKTDGVVNGEQNGKGTERISTLNLPATPDLPVPPAPLKLECVSCPKPKYRGKEGTPRVTYDIAADGRVTNVRLRKSSGDPDMDRETLEAMSKWQFNPKTVPEGGRANVKVRVTFEESGSQFQRQNEEDRRRREAEQQRIADQEREKREAQRLQPATTSVKEPKPEPVYVPPTPAYVPPESVYEVPAPAYIPPEPVYEAPPELPSGELE